MGNKVRKRRSDRQIGDLIVQAWRDAANSAVDPFVIDRRALIENLINGNYVDTGRNTGGNNKRIVLDVVFDTDLDNDTRLVWIAIPTPDTGRTKVDWDRYINNLTPTDIEKIGTSVLFGCGR